jgi:hypothetical protein
MDPKNLMHKLMFHSVYGETGSYLPSFQKVNANELKMTVSLEFRNAYEPLAGQGLLKYFSVNTDT